MLMRRRVSEQIMAFMQGVPSTEIEGLITALAIDHFVPCLELLGHVFGSYDKETNDFIDFGEYQCKQTRPDNDPDDRRRWELSTASRHLLLDLVVLGVQIDGHDKRPNEQ